MLRKTFELLQEAIKTVLTEKFKAFRTGFIGGGIVSAHFLFSLHGLSADLIWILPLKLFISVTFSFCTGITSQATKDVYIFVKNRIRIKKRRKSMKKGQQQNNKTP